MLEEVEDMKYGKQTKCTYFKIIFTILLVHNLFTYSSKASFLVVSDFSCFPSLHP